MQFINKLQDKNYNFIYAIIMQIAMSMLFLSAYSYSTMIFLDKFPRSWLPYYYLTIAVFTALVTIGFMPIVNKNAKRPILHTIFAIFIVICFFAAIKLFGIDNSVFIFIFTFLLIIVVKLFGSIVWNLIASGFDVRSFKQVTKWGIIINGIVSSCLGVGLYFLILVFSHEVLLFSIIFFVFVIYACAYLLQIVKFSTPKPWQPVATLRYRLFIYMLLFALLSTLCATFIDYFLKFRLSETLTKTEIATYMTIFYTVGYVLTSLLQFITNKVIEKFGLFMLMMILPLIILLFTIPTLFYPNLTLVTILAVVWNGTHYSFYLTGRQVILNALPDIIRRKGLLIIKSYGNQAASLLAAVVIWLFAYYFDFYPYQILLILFSLIMVYLAYKIQQHYKLTLYDSIKEKRFNQQLLYQTRDDHAFEPMVNNLLHEDAPQQILLGLSLLKHSHSKHLPTDVPQLIKNQDIKIKLECIKAVKKFHDEHGMEVLYENLDSQTKPSVVWAIFELLQKEKPSLILEHIDQYLSHHELCFQAGATLCAINHGNMNQVSSALKRLQVLIHGKNTHARVWAAQIIGNIALGKPEQELLALINDPEPAVSIAAIRAAGKRKILAVLPTILNKLPNSKLKPHIHKAISLYGKTAIPTLVSAIQAQQLRSYKDIIRSLANIEDPAVNNAFIELLALDSQPILNEIAKQILIRACRHGISLILRQALLAKMQTDTTLLQALLQLASLQLNEFQYHEVQLRIHLLEKRLLYWFAALTQPHLVVQIIPFFFFTEENTAMQLKKAHAIELLENLALEYQLDKDMLLLLERKISVNVASSDLLSLLQTINDTWLSTIFDPNKTGIAMETFEKIKYLRSSTIFAELPAETLISIAEATATVYAVKGETVYSDDQISPGMYLLACGQIELCDKEKHIRFVEAHDLFGIPSLFDESLKPIIAKATADSTLLFLDRQTFLQLTDDYPDIMRAIIKFVMHFYGYILRARKRADLDNDQVA